MTKRVQTGELAESVVEQAVLAWFESLGYQVLPAPAIAPGELLAERVTYGDVILIQRLRAGLCRVNPGIPSDAIEDAIRKITRTESPNPTESNRRFHRFLTDGVPVEYQGEDGRVVHDYVCFLDFKEPADNDWLAVNQFTVVEDRNTRRPDMVVFVNGLPLAVIELKNPQDESATTRTAFNQLQTYKQEIPSLFQSNEVLVVSDGLEARVGTLTAGWDRFMPWRTVAGDEVAAAGSLELEVLIKGLLEKSRFLDLVRNFIVFEVDGGNINKKMAAYHQFHAVNKAVDCTVEASAPAGDRRVGVVWHTQGSGKSLTMVFYAGKVIRHARMMNPTVVVITDRNDLDDQLFDTFAACQDILRQTPVQAENREHLQALLRVSAGVLEIFSAAGLKTPDISIFSDEFLEEVRDMPQRNLALEALKKLLADQIKLLERKNLIQSRRFSEMLEQTLLRYQSRTIESAQAIAEMIELAREMREANRRGERLRMSEEELAFYDALEVNDSAVKIMGDEVLRSIARELVETIRRNTTIDWTVKESVRAKLRTTVKRILRKYGYPPDKQEKATGTVLEQAELLGKDWAA